MDGNEIMITSYKKWGFGQVSPDTQSRQQYPTRNTALSDIFCKVSGDIRPSPLRITGIITIFGYLTRL